MTDIHPTSSLNWVRLLTMSTHPNPIQRDRFRPPHLYSIQHTTSRWKNHRNCKAFDDVQPHIPNPIQMDSFRPTTPTVYNTLQADERTTGTVRLLTMSSHTSQIRSRWTVSVPPHLHSIQYTTSRWKNHRNWQETHVDRPKWLTSTQQHHEIE